jgi:hypothetical protein
MRASLVMLALVTAASAARAEMPAIQQVSARMAETKSQESATVRNYTVLRHYSLAVPHAAHVAEMMVRLTYSYPGHKKFDVLWERGANSIQKRVLRKLLIAEEDSSRFDTRVTADNYDFRLEGEETVEGRLCYVLRLKPKVSNKYLLRGRAWVDAIDFAVVRVEGTPVDDGSFWIRNTRVAQRYKKVAGFWLPAVNKADSEVRIFGPAHLTIESLDYQISPSDDENRAEVLSRRPPLE